MNNLSCTDIQITQEVSTREYRLVEKVRHADRDMEKERAYIYLRVLTV